MKDEIVYTALENLNKNTGIQGIYAPSNQTNELDGAVDFVLNNTTERFFVEVKKEIRYHQLEHINQMAITHGNFLLISDSLFPNIKAEMRKKGISYLDAAGNIFLNTDKQHIWIEGHKNEKKGIEKINRAFTSTGLKAVYLFLIDDNFINQTQRTIADEAGIALGNINLILHGLKEQGFLIETSKKVFQIINKKGLFEKWMAAYEDKLKPALHIGNFRLLDMSDGNNWKKINLKPDHTFWGGEPAGEIITNYLIPEILTIYTSETRNDLIKNYQMIPDPEGNIRVYKKFWKHQATYSQTVVHPLLAYADLLSTGNSRCVETANLIFEHHVKKNI